MKTLLIGSLLAFCCGMASAADLPALVRKVEPGIVAVGTHLVLRREQDALRGTGFAVGDGRHVITNSHVVPRNMDEARRESVAVERPERGGRLKMHKATVVKRDKEMATSNRSGTRYAIPVSHVRSLLSRAGLGY